MKPVASRYTDYAIPAPSEPPVDVLTACFRVLFAKADWTDAKGEVPNKLYRRALNKVLKQQELQQCNQ
jgi:hypothetical protein